MFLIFKSCQVSILLLIEVLRGDKVNVNICMTFMQLIKVTLINLSE